MIKLSRALLAAMSVVTMATLAGCGGQAHDAAQTAAPTPPLASTLPPGSGPVTDVLAICGVQGVYWRETWWLVDPPIQAVRNASSAGTVSGTMTTISDRQARLDSPGLAAPQILSMTNLTNPNSPPFVQCQPSTS